MRLLLSFLVFYASIGVACAHRGPARLIRTHVLLFELNKESFVEWSRGETSYKSMLGIVKKGEAKVLDTNIAIGRFGERVTIESVREEIYPTEYEPPGRFPVEGVLEVIPAKPVRQTVDIAYETRNVGMNLELESIFTEDGESIDLRISSEFVDSVGYTKWIEYKDEWGQSDVKRPIYLSHRLDTTLITRDGKFSLVGVFTGKDKKGELDPNRKLVMFVMSEIVKVQR